MFVLIGMIILRFVVTISRISPSNGIKGMDYFGGQTQDAGTGTETCGTQGESLEVATTLSCGLRLQLRPR